MNNDSIESDTENTNNKINNQQMRLHRTERFCTAKETLKMERLSTEGEKILEVRYWIKG